MYLLVKSSHIIYFIPHWPNFDSNISRHFETNCTRWLKWLFFTLLWRSLWPVSQTGFPSQLNFIGNFALPSHRFYQPIATKILYMTRQLCCRGICTFCDLMSTNKMTSFYRIWIASKNRRWNGIQGVFCLFVFWPEIFFIGVFEWLV